MAMKLLISYCLIYLLSNVYLPTTKGQQLGSREVINFALVFIACLLVTIQQYPLTLATGSSAIIATAYVLLQVYLRQSPTLIGYTVSHAMYAIVIIICWAAVTRIQLKDIEVFITHIYTQNSLIAILAYLMVAKPGSIIVAKLLKRWDLAEESEQPSNKAGQAIGFIERFLIVTFILINQFSAIGFLLATKSIFRFGDLTKEKHHGQTEYVILGTLASFTLAIIIGLIANYLIKLL